MDAWPVLDGPRLHRPWMRTLLAAALCCTRHALKVYPRRPQCPQVADGYRPPMLATVPPSVQDAINACWKGSAQLRPTARAVVEMLEAIEASGGCGRCAGAKRRAFSARSPWLAGCALRAGWPAIERPCTDTMPGWSVVHLLQERSRQTLLRARLLEGAAAL